MRQWSVETRQLGQGKVQLRIRGVFAMVHGSAPPPPTQWVETTPQETGFRPKFAELDPGRERRGVALCKEIGEVESAFSVSPALMPRPPASRSGSLRARPTTDRHGAAVDQAFPSDSSVFCTAAFEAPREQHRSRLVVVRARARPRLAAELAPDHALLSLPRTPRPDGLRLLPDLLACGKAAQAQAEARGTVPSALQDSEPPPGFALLSESNHPEREWERGK
ncbi:hypothetical protein CMUS01_13650 [Colletotrichum musicola]|uniref:Uncharacterized protein n=1 Tax=Colletotrichum musicola TaxID=2175873 RepID=A0A8H6JBK5_9PEZI|nr:hypothetical protein CMUS01_13650 [Colletotrichum musicola]